MAEETHAGLQIFLGLVDQFRKTCEPFAISEFSIPDWPENLKLEVSLGKKDLFIFSFSGADSRSAPTFPLGKATLVRMVDREVVLGIETSGVLCVRVISPNGDNTLRASSRQNGLSSCLQTLLVFGQFLDEFAEKAGIELAREIARRKEMLEHINRALAPFLAQLVAQKLADSNKPSPANPPR